MKLQNAVKRLEAAGYSVSVSAMFLNARRGEYVILCARNGGGDDLCTIKVRHENDHDEAQTDYSAGSFFDSLAKAMRYAERSNAEMADPRNRATVVHPVRYVRTLAPWVERKTAEFSESMKNANSRLMFAAPDLLAALEECVADLEGAYVDGQGARPTAVSATIHRAHEAIAKATKEPAHPTA